MTITELVIFAVSYIAGYAIGAALVIGGMSLFYRSKK